MAEKNSLDQKLHDLDEAGAIHDFFETVLHSTPEQAEIASRTMRHLFKWSGVRLLWNNENTGGVAIVAVDHADQVREFLTEKHFDFLLPKPGAIVDGYEAAAIPGDMLEAALNGSLTEKGKITMLLGGSNADAVARTELLLKAERTKRANGANGADDANRHGQTQNERRLNGSADHRNNPFARLSRATTPAEKLAAQSAISSYIRAAGTKAAVATAKSAGLTLSGQPLRQ
jgi:hypothetical protein